jgi:hypothetical protein
VIGNNWLPLRLDPAEREVGVDSPGTITSIPREDGARNGIQKSGLGGRRWLSLLAPNGKSAASLEARPRSLIQLLFSPGSVLGSILDST